MRAVVRTAVDGEAAALDEALGAPPGVYAGLLGMQAEGSCVLLVAEVGGRPVGAGVLRWLPRGTHQYEKLVRPEELEKPLVAGGMTITDRTGVFFHPLQNRWNLSSDMDVNYMMLAKKAAQ